jgi:HIV Tat-specific factor 1
MNESWKKNNAGTIHAMQSRINELEGELAESKEDNESLARHLRSMVERVESYIEELEALDLKAKQREWDVLTTEAAEKVLAESNTVAKEEDEEDEEEEEEEEDDDDDRWALDGDSDDDATVYELDEDSEEEEPEWFTHAPKDTKVLPYQQMREDALRMRVMLKAEAEELKEWNTDDVTLGERENETEDLEYDTASQDENEDLKEWSAVDENEEFTEFDTEDYVVLWSDNEDLEEWGAEDDTLVWSETEAESENETEQKTEENEDLNGSCMENEKVANRWSDDEDEDEDEDLLIVDDWKADSEAVKCVW